jgi:RNA polymerase sigma-70 factor (ECF subfamily)
MTAEEFDALYREHAGRVLAYCRRRTRSGAEDALAETFATAWRRRDDLPSDPLPWLYGVARRVLANQHRAARRQTAVAHRLADAARPGEPDESTPVLAALARLRPSDRELLMLVAWEGLTPARAARAVGTSAATCRVRLFRARRRLERLLADDAPRLSVREEALS